MLLRTVYRDLERGKWTEDLSHMYVSPLGEFMSELLAEKVMHGWRWQLLRDARRQTASRPLVVMSATLVECRSYRRQWYLYTAEANNRTLDYAGTFYSRESAEAWLLKCERQNMRTRQAERWSM